MVKYKLIRTYPGSPKLGFILDDSWKNKHGGCNSNPYTINNLSFNPENHKEFWEEVIEKDYEILSLRSLVNNNKGAIKKVINNSYIENTDEYPLENAIKNWVNYFKTWEIYSVKRLSDNEIFTIGDKYKNVSGTFTIESFDLEDNQMFIQAEEFGRCLLYSMTKIEKQLLFKTEDGIDVYEGDNIYGVTDDFKLAYSSNITKNHPVIRSFSSKENAENYIKYNKPALSISDVLKYLPDSIDNNELPKFIENLEKLVK